MNRLRSTIILTDDYARIELKDEQATRVIQLRDALAHFTDQNRLPVSADSITRLHGPISKALFGGVRPGKKLKTTGLYEILERINQADTRTVFLASHRYTERQSMDQVCEDLAILKDE